MGAVMEAGIDAMAVSAASRTPFALLTALASALCVALVIVTALYVAQRRRIARLAGKVEAFLAGEGEMLEFSVREDAMAPLHNACAELQNRLVLARERQAEECRRTSDLTADISHQLKTPLASLRLFCEMDESAHVSEQLSQIERMERLIGSLLRLERLCADGYAFHFAPHDVGRIVRESWSGICAMFPACSIEVEGEAVIRCDEKWLGEAFVNLFKNACEHMSEGGRVRVAMETTQTAFFCTVTDEGGGVSAKDLAHLFDRFYRTAGSPGTGAGIGLAIVKEIVWRHHGSIRAENAENGLRMTLSIPLLNLAKS